MTDKAVVRRTGVEGQDGNGGDGFRRVAGKELAQSSQGRLAVGRNLVSVGNEHAITRAGTERAPRVGGKILSAPATRFSISFSSGPAEDSP